MDTPAEQVARLREEASNHDRNAWESFERCDTDGFLSQWASGINARQARMKADLIERGGKMYLVGPVTQDGEATTHRQVDTRFGRRWIVLPDGDPDGDALNWLNAEAVRMQTIRKHGFTLGVYRTEATVRVAGREITAVQPYIVPKERTLTPDNSELIATLSEHHKLVRDAYDLIDEIEDAG